MSDRTIATLHDLQPTIFLGQPHCMGSFYQGWAPLMGPCTSQRCIWRHIPDSPLAAGYNHHDCFNVEQQNIYVTFCECSAEADGYSYYIDVNEDALCSTCENGLC